MSLFGLFKRSESASLKKHGERVANRRAQAPDRWDSIQALSKLASADAARYLLERFTYTTDPSITDQEEKDAAFRAIVDTGEAAVEPVLAFLRKTDSISWPLKILDQLLPVNRVIEELLHVLEKMDTEYERDPQKKIQVLACLEERKDERVIPAVTRFLADVNESARFHAVGATLAQDDSVSARELLQQALSKEDSVRVRIRILEGFAERSWSVGEARKSIISRLPERITLDDKGVPRVKKTQ